MRLVIILPFAAAVLAAPACQDDITLTVSATAAQIIFPEDLNITSLLGLAPTALRTLAKTFPLQNQTGSYTVQGRYCKPEVFVAARANTVQLLVHGIGYTRNYWSGEGLPGSAEQLNGTVYSWVDYASQRGYPTFSIDRLCNGESTHIASLLCQTQLNAAVVHDVAQQLRQGAVGGTKFSKVICVGHSLGSLIVQSATQTYPQDFDAVVLTGYSLRLLSGFVGSVTAYAPVPGALALSQKYGALDPGYLVSGIQKGFEQLFFYGSYTQSLIDIDFSRRGPFAIGELVTALLGMIPAVKYTGSVMVLTGQEDQVFCAQLPVAAVLDVPADCGSGSSSASAEAQKVYPNAKSFSWHQVQEAGHCLNLHTNAKTTFEQAHKFMATV